MTTGGRGGGGICGFVWPLLEVISYCWPGAPTVLDGGGGKDAKPEGGAFSAMTSRLESHPGAVILIRAMGWSRMESSL